jgi:hypothetical protein
MPHAHNRSIGLLVLNPKPLIKNPPLTHGSPPCSPLRRTLFSSASHAPVHRRSSWGSPMQDMGTKSNPTPRTSSFLTANAPPRRADARSAAQFHPAAGEAQAWSRAACVFTRPGLVLQFFIPPNAFVFAVWAATEHITEQAFASWYVRAAQCPCQASPQH